MTELRVFISYRRDDTSGDARSIYQHLSRCFGRDRIFMDVDSIRPGGDFREVLRESLGSTRVLLALIGPKWNENNRLSNPADFVRLEVLGALDAGISVIPLLIDNTTMPLPEELPAALESLAYRQALSIRHQTFSSDVRALEHAIAAELGVTDAPIADQTNTESGLPSTPITEVELQFSIDSYELRRLSSIVTYSTESSQFELSKIEKVSGDSVSRGDKLGLVSVKRANDRRELAHLISPVTGVITAFGNYIGKDDATYYEHRKDRAVDYWSTRTTILKIRPNCPEEKISSELFQDMVSDVVQVASVKKFDAPRQAKHVLFTTVIA